MNSDVLVVIVFGIAVFMLGVLFGLTLAYDAIWHNKGIRRGGHIYRLKEEPEDD